MNLIPNDLIDNREKYATEVYYEHKCGVKNLWIMSGRRGNYPI